MLSIISLTSLGGRFVKFETEKATTKFIIIPKKPNPSGEIPKNQLSGELKEGFKNLK